VFIYESTQLIIFIHFYNLFTGLFTYFPIQAICNVFICYLTTIQRLWYVSLYLNYFMYSIIYVFIYFIIYFICLLPFPIYDEMLLYFHQL